MAGLCRRCGGVFLTCPYCHGQGVPHGNGSMVRERTGGQETLPLSFKGEMQEQGNEL